MPKPKPATTPTPEQAGDPGVAAREQLKALLNMAKNSAAQLRAAREQAEVQLAEVQRRVQSDETGAELIVPLHEEIKKALEMEQKLNQSIAKLDRRIETNGSSGN